MKGKSDSEVCNSLIEKQGEILTLNFPASLSMEWRKGLLAPYIQKCSAFKDIEKAKERDTTGMVYEALTFSLVYKMVPK